jgi:hypothetical protein
MKYLMLFFLVLAGFAASAQKKSLYEYDDVVALAKSELDSSMHVGVFKEFAVKNRVKGEYIMDITIHEKGKVLTVFSVSNDTDDLKKQTLVKDFLRKFLFTFKMPKGRTYKFQYTFSFQ